MSEKHKPTATIPPFGLRLQPPLRKLLDAACEESGRSMNAEIARRLEQSFARPEDEIVRRRLPESQLQQILDRLDKQQRDIDAIGGKVGVAVGPASKKKPTR